jgi:hypothetical protein
MKAFLATLVLFFGSVSSLHAQEQPIGFFVESGSGSMVCVAYKTFGQPAYFVVRTTNPQSFFLSIQDVQKCLLNVKKQITDYKKNAQEMVPYFFLEPSRAPFVGEFENMICKEWRNKKGLSVMYEFTLPYLEKYELLSFVHETPFRACLSTVEAVSVSWKEQS